MLALNLNSKKISYRFGDDTTRSSNKKKYYTHVQSEKNLIINNWHLSIRLESKPLETLE